MLVIGDKIPNFGDDIRKAFGSKSVDQPKADHLHDDTVKLFTEFIKRAIKDIDAGTNGICYR